MDSNLVAFSASVGRLLGPLYLGEPNRGDAKILAETFFALSEQEAVDMWYCVSSDRVCSSLSLMKQGLQDGVANDLLVEEYRRLFAGPAALPVPPWGSVYTDREQVLFGASTVALRAWMKENGIKALGEQNVPEDHLGTMLILMSWIAEEKDRLLEEFLSVHFLPWSHHLLVQLEAAACQPFYQGLARLTDATLEGIKETACLEVNYPHFYR